VPAIAGGQSCESCGSAESRLGPPSSTVTTQQLADALVAGGFTGELPGGVNASVLINDWYAARIASEGNWRTLARILSDSGHACSSTLHADALAGSAPAGTVWRYFFDYTAKSDVLPGATHGGDESWLFRKSGATADEITLSKDMASWWASLAAAGDPNGTPNAGAPAWTAYAPPAGDSMFMGEAHDPIPRLGSNPDTVRVECEHWKQFMGFY